MVRVLLNSLQRKILFFWSIAGFDFLSCKVLLDPYDFQDAFGAMAGAIGCTALLFVYFKVSKTKFFWYAIFPGLILFAFWDIQNPALIGQHAWKFPPFRGMEAELGGSLAVPDVINPLPTQAYQIGVSLVVIVSLLFTAVGFHKEKIKVLLVKN